MGGLDGEEERRLRGRIQKAIRRSRWLGHGFRWGTAAVAAGVLLLAAGFVAFLAISAYPEVLRAGFGFLTGSQWNAGTGVFGALPAIVGTLLTCGLALLFAVPVGLGVAIFSAEIAPRRVRAVVTYIVELGAVIPSIVYGFWALIVLVPFLHGHLEPWAARTLGPRLGFSGLALGVDVLAASAILGVMIVPTIAAFSREALLAVPRQRREAALALGATRWEAARLAVFGPAAPGIVGAIVLGLGRALGEAIAVVLVISPSYIYPSSFLSPGVTIPSWIVNRWPDAGPQESAALFELGLVLFVLSFAVNIGARLVLRRRSGAAEGPSASPKPRRLGRLPRHRLAPPGAGVASVPGWWPKVAAGRDRRIRRRRLVHLLVVALLVAALAVAIYPLASLTRLMVENGGSSVVRPSFYTDPLPVPCYHNCSLGGIGPPIQGTLLLLGFASMVAVPVGLCTGIYLSEYARGRFRSAAGLVVDAMVGIPSILIGLFVFSVFYQLRPDLAQTALSGGLALGVLMVPIVARATETALHTVPSTVRESALALGFPRHRVTTRIVLGNCRSALVTGCLLALGRAGGETAALLFTVGWSQYGFAGWGQPVSAMAPFIYEALEYVGTPNWVRDAWGAALLLLILMLAVSVAARLSLRTGEATMTE